MKTQTYFRIGMTLLIAIVLLSGFIVAQSLITGTPITTKTVTFIYTWTKNAVGEVSLTANKINYNYNQSMLKITEVTQRNGRTYYVVQSQPNFEIKK